MNVCRTVSAMCLLFCALSFASCAKKGSVSFCEGIDSKGKGVKCGKVFTTGDLTIVFNAKDDFGTDDLTVKVFNIDAGDRNPKLVRHAKVKPDENTGHADLDLYDEGRFRVVVEKRGEAVSSGEIEIIDSIPGDAGSGEVDRTFYPE